MRLLKFGRNWREEAALFASDLLRMYSKFSELKNWKVEIMDISQTDHNGVKEVILNISGKDVFGNLKYESGTHRVQRVPQTESGGGTYICCNSCSSSRSKRY